MCTHTHNDETQMMAKFKEIMIGYALL
jgi:hypothetical protein